LVFVGTLASACYFELKKQAEASVPKRI